MEIKKVGYIEEYTISDPVKKLSKKEKRILANEVFKKQYQGKVLTYKALTKAMFVKINADTRASFKKPKKNETNKNFYKKIEITADKKLLEIISNPMYVNRMVEKKSGQSIRHKDGQYFYYFIKRVSIDGELFNLVIDVRQRLDGKNIVHDVILK